MVFKLITFNKQAGEVAAQALWQEVKLHLYSAGVIPGCAGKRGGLTSISSKEVCLAVISGLSSYRKVLGDFLGNVCKSFLKVSNPGTLDCTSPSLPFLPAGDGTQQREAAQRLCAQGEQPSHSAADTRAELGWLPQIHTFNVVQVWAYSHLLSIKSKLILQLAFCSHAGAVEAAGGQVILGPGCHGQMVPGPALIQLV